MCENADFAIILYLNVVLGYKAEITANEIFTKGVKSTYTSVIKDYKL